MNRTQPDETTARTGTGASANRAIPLALAMLACLVAVGCGRTEKRDRFGRAASSEAGIVGGRGNQPGYFSRPRAIAALPDGGFITIDRTGRIQRFDAKGHYHLHWWLDDWENGTPTGFCVDPRDDSLWIADTHYQRILHYSSAGERLGSFGEAGTGPGQMIFPTDCALDPDDFTLWVTEYGNRNRIMHFTAQGDFLGEWGGVAMTEDDLLRPQSLLAVPGGELLVCDAGHHRIWRFRRTPGAPEPLGSWGVAGTAPGALRYPYALDAAPDGSIYVVEYGNSRVSRFTPEGEFLGTWGGPGHGPNQLFSPWGLSVDSKNRRLFVADTNNNRILVVSPLP